MANDMRFQLIFEAVDRTKGAVQSLNSNLAGVKQQAQAMKAQLGEAAAFLAGGLVTGGVMAGLGILISKLAATTEKSEGLKAAMTGLAATARYAGEDIGRSMDAASKLAADGLLNVTASSRSLQNLLSRGFSLDEAIQMIERLKDAAAFNRQASLSMSDAVQSATEGLKNENSILVDNAGVTKNVSVMWKEYAAQIGKGVNSLSQAEKRQAEFNGIMRETDGQVGNAKLAMDGLTGAKARFKVEVDKVSAAVGQTLTPAFTLFTKIGTGVLEYVVKPLIASIEILTVKFADFLARVNRYAGLSLMDLIKGKHKQIDNSDLDRALDDAMLRIAKKWDTGTAEQPQLGKDTGNRRQDVVTPEQTAAELKKLAETWADLKRQLTLDVKQLGLDEFEQKIVAINAKAEEMASKEGFGAEQKKAIEAWRQEMIQFQEILAAEADLDTRASRKKKAIEALKELAAAREADIQQRLAAIDLAEQERAIDKGEAVRERLALLKELLAIQQEYLNKLNKTSDPASWYAQANAIQATREQLIELNEQLLELTGTGMEGWRRGLDDYVRNARTRFQQLRDLATDTAQSMEGSFSDLFFDAMHLKLKSLQDYAESVLSAIARQMSDLLAERLVGWGLNQLGFGNSTPGGNLDPNGMTPVLPGQYQLRTANMTVNDLRAGGDRPPEINLHNYGNEQLTVNREQSTVRYDQQFKRWVGDIVVEKLAQGGNGMDRSLGRMMGTRR
jgi:lambda family phage tail tape measure protein